VVDRLRRFERDNQFPGLFITELERCFHTSRNGRHLCQIFPVLGPSLATLSNEPLLLYPSFVKDFARQLARALHTLHGLGICHGGKRHQLAQSTISSL
jgi:serine/threonine protein kinase